MSHGKDDADGASVFVGGPMSHIPVMLNEVVAALFPASGDVIIDGTFGAGGYSTALMEKGATILGIDQDPNAVASGQALVERYRDQLELVHGRFSDLESIANDREITSVDGVVLDIGVSSMQLDQAERGFSFQKDGPLDMRMSQRGLSAADVVNFADHSTLTRILGILGEERHAPRISRAIINARDNVHFSNTLQLSNLIEKTIGRKPGDKIHPATRSFQGLRIFVNQELEELAKALFAAERIIKPGGHLVVVSFHSLEDRIVKRFFADRTGKASGSRHLPQAISKDASFSQEKRGAILASKSETQANPRSRSAKLRAGTRTASQAQDENMEIFGLPKLSLSQVNKIA